MSSEAPKTPRTDRKGWRGVFASPRFWFFSAEWSAVAFVTAAGLTAILWAYFTGSDGRIRGFVMRRVMAPPAPVAEPAPEPEPVAADVPRHPLDGAVMAEVADRSVFAVVIDNIGAARPHAGVSRARLVYEAPVEGGITRLLAFFADDGEEIGKIGPVRSARPYFQDWAETLDAAYAHVGGSPEALERLGRGGVVDLNQYFWGAYYWRDRARSAPHNVYTSMELLQRALSQAKTFRTEEEKGTIGLFVPEPPASSVDARKLTIDISTPQFLVEWEYDEESGEYVRYQGGKRVADEDGSVVRANNVVVHYTKVRILDEVGRRQIDTRGPGRAIVARNGRIIEAEWSAEAGAPAVYTDADGDPLTLVPGVTWIQVVPEGTEVGY